MKPRNPFTVLRSDGTRRHPAAGTGHGDPNRKPTPAEKQLRQAKAEAAAAKRKERDDRFVASLVAGGLPEPVREYRFHPTRRWRFDFAWPEQKVALEVDGGVWTGGRHTRGAGFIGDMEKLNAAGLAGWRFLRATPKDLRDPALALSLGQLLRDGGPSAAPSSN